VLEAGSAGAGAGDISLGISTELTAVQIDADTSAVVASNARQLDRAHDVGCVLAC
jgi:hypothetical protein